MQTSLAWAGLLMGLTGGPHCVVMCGAACAGISQMGAKPAPWRLWLFQLGRVVGYGLLGTVAAGSLQGLGWMTIHSEVLRPVWTFFHLIVGAWGIFLLLMARQPVWVEGAGRWVWQGLRRLGAASEGPKGALAIAVLGMSWALLPCGLLYSALLLASLSSEVWQGGVIMVLFAAGTSVSMMLGPWLWLRLGRRGDAWAVRLAGTTLALSALWALWMGLMHNTAPWCVSPV
jgi:sulfite exporter TauE/SafE